MKIKAIFLVLILLVVLSTVGFAMSETVNWKTVPVDAGQGLFVPCSTGIVTSYVWDGMAVVECHPKGKQAVERRFVKEGRYFFPLFVLYEFNNSYIHCVSRSI